MMQMYSFCYIVCSKIYFSYAKKSIYLCKINGKKNPCIFKCKYLVNILCFVIQKNDTFLFASWQLSNMPAFSKILALQLSNGADICEEYFLICMSSSCFSACIQRKKIFAHVFFIYKNEKLLKIGSAPDFELFVVLLAFVNKGVCCC